MPDLYDDAYPGDVAGHVEAGAFITDDAVRTTEGDGEYFTGDHVPPKTAHGLENVSNEAVNRNIGRAMDRRNAFRHKRRIVDLTGDDWIPGNTTLQDSNATILVKANFNRKDVVVTNQSNAVVYLGRERGLKAAAPNTCYLPAGASRTFEHQGNIFVVGVAGQVIDFVETVYSE